MREMLTVILHLQTRARAGRQNDLLLWRSWWVCLKEVSDTRILSRYIPEWPRSIRLSATAYGTLEQTPNEHLLSSLSLVDFINNFAIERLTALNTMRKELLELLIYCRCWIEMCNTVPSLILQSTRRESGMKDCILYYLLDESIVTYE